MKALLLGQHSQSILPIVEDLGIQIVDSVGEQPDFAICFGGDGTLLGAERDYPGLPKVPIRQWPNDESAGKKFREILERVVARKHQVTYLPKLLACRGETELYAINDIVMHNANIVSAVRFSVQVEGLQPFGEIVGDGLVISTPFGSSAYYRAITNSVIHVGIGLAFNNSTEPVNHLVLSDHTAIRICITRGPAVLAADNNPDLLSLTDGDVIDCRLSSQQAEIWEINNLLTMKSFSNQSGRRLRWLENVTRKK